MRFSSFSLTVHPSVPTLAPQPALFNTAYCCYLSDLAVHRDYQRKGIDKELVRRLREMLGDEVMILLLAAPEAMEYYPKIGFEKVENAWKIPRLQSYAKHLRGLHKEVWGDLDATEYVKKERDSWEP